MGSGQDAGVPQVGCSCRQCCAARSDHNLKRLAPSLLLRNEDAEQAIVIDASPDIREQLDRYLPPLGLRSVKAVFITHGHVGHYWGLALIGKEGPDLKGVTVYATADVVGMLRATPAVSLMESRGNIRMETICPGGQDAQCEPVSFRDLSIEAFYVPHRQELTKTLGSRLRGPEKTLVYIPDIDRWTPEAVATAKSADFALLDGTFFSGGELGGTRTMAEIPHPPISDSLKVFGIQGRQGGSGIYFTHLNHTNPAGLHGAERDQVLRAGLGIAFDGMRMRI